MENAPKSSTLRLSWVALRVFDTKQQAGFASGKFKEHVEWIRGMPIRIPQAKSTVVRVVAFKGSTEVRPLEQLRHRFLSSPSCEWKMRINLSCPYSQKDEARALGARWDSIKRVWYIVDVEDLTPFMRWISAEEINKPEQCITLCDYLGQNYRGAMLALTFEAAKAFGVPYPLEKGWAKKYGARSITLARMNAIKRPVGKKQAAFNAVQPVAQVIAKPLADANHSKRWAVTGPKVVSNCGCNVLPWDDCEHTESAAQAAMEEMLA